MFKKFGSHNFVLSAIYWTAQTVSKHRAGEWGSYNGYYTKLRLTFWFVCSCLRGLFCAEEGYLRYMIGTRYAGESCIRRGCSPFASCLFLACYSNAALLWDSKHKKISWLHADFFESLGKFTTWPARLCETSRWMDKYDFMRLDKPLYKGVEIKILRAAWVISAIFSSSHNPQKSRLYCLILL